MAFSAHEVLEHSWIRSKSTYWRWWPVIIVAAIIPLVLQIIAGALGGWASSMDGFGAAILALLGAIFGIAAILAGLLMFLGIFRNAYEVSGGGAPSVGRLFERSHYWWFAAAFLIYVAMIFVGLFALIIPGLIIAFMLGLYPYALIGGQAGNGFSALATSWDRISSHFWKYVGLRIVLLGVPIAVVLGVLLALSVIGGGAALGMGFLGDGGAEGILVGILGIAAFVIGVLLYVLAVVFVWISDATAYRKLAPEWAS